MPRYSPRTGLLETYQVGPFDSAHVYVQWGGKLPGGETWACGLRMRKKTGTTTVADGTSLLVGVSSACVTMHQAATTNLGTGAKLSFVKVNAIGTDGKYLDGGGTNQGFFSDLPGAGTSAQTAPNQVAMAVTWTTGFSRGPAHKGRFYLPLFNTSLDTNGLVPAANVTSLKGGINTFLTNLNAVNTAFEVAVFSRKAGAAGNRRVTGVSIGRALDTQRRRRRSLTEDYQ